MILSKMSKKGQIVIPKEIREQFNINAGDVIIFKIQDHEIKIEKIGVSMNDILKARPPLNENSVEFQRKLRGEWD